jgi:hypothetical protein
MLVSSSSSCGEAVDGGIVDEPIEQRGEVEDLAVGAAHGCERVGSAETFGDPGVDLRLVFAFVRQDILGDARRDVTQ